MRPITPARFRQEHGDPSDWSAQEIDAYFESCDGTQAVYTRLERAADFMTANPGATSAEVLAAFRGESS